MMYMSLYYLRPFQGIMQGKSVSVMSFLNIPISIILGIDHWIT